MDAKLEGRIEFGQSTSLKPVYRMETASLYSHGQESSKPDPMDDPPQQSYNWLKSADKVHALASSDHIEVQASVYLASASPVCTHLSMRQATFRERVMLASGIARMSMRANRSSMPTQAQLF